MAKPPKGIEVIPKVPRDAARVLSSAALNFLAGLQRMIDTEAADEAPVLEQRSETRAIRDSAWKIAALPKELQDLRSVIVTPTSRKAMITALNSGAKFCVADFADMTVPAWDGLLEGQANLMDRWTSAMEHVDPVTARRIGLSQHLASLMVRPRPLGQEEPRVKIDGKPMSAGVFDAGLYLFHNAATAIAKVSAPYLCLSGIESPAEARQWNDLIIRIQSELALPLGTIRVMVMVDSLPSAFALDEIIFELRDHIAGLAHGGWRFGASFIAHSEAMKAKVLGDHVDVAPFQAALSGLIVNIAHRRGCLALGPLLGQTPVEKDAARLKAGAAVRAGLDGLLLAHAEIVPVAAAMFNDDMPTPNQIYVTHEDLNGGPSQLLKSNSGERSEDALRANIRSCLVYFESWLQGRAAIMIDGAIEDAARADFRWTQVWQWLNQAVKLDSGARVTPELFDECLADEAKRLRAERGEEAWRSGRFKEAAALLKSLCLAETLAPSFIGAAMRKLP